MTKENDCWVVCINCNNEWLVERCIFKYEIECPVCYSKEYDKIYDQEGSYFEKEPAR